MSEFAIRGNRLSEKNFQLKMAPLQRSAVCILSSLIIGFSVLLQLNDVLLYLNLTVYKYERQKILSLIRRHLKLCNSAFEASSGHGLAETWKRKLETIVSYRIRHVKTPKKIIRLQFYRIRGNGALTSIDTQTTRPSINANTLFNNWALFESKSVLAKAKYTGKLDEASPTISYCYADF